MSQNDDCVLVADAIARLHAAAGLPWPPPAANGVVTPAPLDRLIATYNLTHIEMPELTPARAGGFLTTAGGCWSELLKDNTALDGLLVARASGSYIFVRADASNPVSRRRFTAAHELGHYLLHFRPSLESQREPDAPFVRTDDEKTLYEGQDNKVDKVQSPPEWERQANRFAAELLMPEAVCREAYKQYKRTSSRFLEHHLASNLLVSGDAIRWRLRNLGLTS